MTESFRTVKGYGEAELEIQKSRFIGSADRVNSEAEIQEFLGKIRRRFPQARHYCSAWILGQEGLHKRYDDDKEPQGTAGMPILRVLEGNGLTNVCVIVTRYFGGVLLGTGGLTRAYGRCAKQAVEEAKPVLEVPMNHLRLLLSYSDWGTIQNRFMQKQVEILSTEYLENVDVHFAAEQSQTEEWEKWIADVTNGNAVIQEVDQIWRQKPIETKEDKNE